VLRVRWLDMRVVHLATILIAHSPLVIKIVLLLGSMSEPLGSRLEIFPLLLLLLLVFSGGPNVGYMSMRVTSMGRRLEERTWMRL
jgi:hypothetical protein